MSSGVTRLSGWWNFCIALRRISILKPARAQFPFSACAGNGTSRSLDDSAQWDDDQVTGVPDKR